MKHGFGECEDVSAVFSENTAMFLLGNSAAGNALIFEQMLILLAG
jgi:hypothetical protein